MLKPVPFYFLRHGETAWNRRAIMQGHTDIDLDVSGEHQAREVAPAVAALPIATICTSPLRRAVHTADIVNVNRRPVALIDELKECCFGIYEGQPSNGPWRKDWRNGVTLPGVESFEDFVTRILAALTKALEFPGPVLVVGHGGNFWAIERLMGLSNGARVPNCALFRVDPPVAGDHHWRSTLLAQPASPSVAIGEAIAPA